MPAKQRGSVRKQSNGWGVRYYDENGQRPSESGFRTKSAARAWLDEKVAEVEALRRRDMPFGSSYDVRTVNNLIDVFLQRHGPTIEANSLATLTHNLKHARRWFGARDPNGLKRIEIEEWRPTLPVGSRQHIFRALRQVLKWGVERELISRNATDGIRNPGLGRDERKPVVTRLPAVVQPHREGARSVPSGATGWHPERTSG